MEKNTGTSAKFCFHYLYCLPLTTGFLFFFTIIDIFLKYDKNLIGKSFFYRKNKEIMQNKYIVSRTDFFRGVTFIVWIFQSSKHENFIYIFGKMYS